PRRNLSDIATLPAVKRLSYIRSFCIDSIFLLGALLCLFHTHVTSVMARMVFFLIPVALSVSNKLVGRKA
ncbi:MAG TPA: hypothetical protein PLD84_04210, partial [Chitinophagales bacterium]|nr:hypothetical protein [Chitinophagales bacterium]